jgi:hypothetical protein
LAIINFAAIVEGHDEVEAVPILIGRIAAEFDPSLYVNIKPVIRVPVSKLLHGNEIERTIELAARRLTGSCGILVLLDCDWKGCCPAKTGPLLLKRAQKARKDIPISVVLAKRENEAWFIAAAESIRGKRGLSVPLDNVPDPEKIRGAKEWLSKHMAPDYSYSETTDQPALTECFDLHSARRSDSFDKCYREIMGLIRRLRDVQKKR